MKQLQTNMLPQRLLNYGILSPYESRQELWMTLYFGKF